MSKKITLKSSDGELFVIDLAVAIQSQTIAHLVEDDCANGEIPLANVEGKILAKVIDYCQKHVDTDFLSDQGEEDLKMWDANFMNIEQSTVYDVMLAANYLAIKTLLDLTCQTVADMLVDQLRTHLGIEDDLTEEEGVEEIPRENQCAFE